MTDRTVYAQPGEDVIVSAPQGYTLTTVSEDAAHTRVRFRPQVVPPVDPPPVEPPPAGADWFAHPGTIPAGTRHWTSGSLGAFLSGLKAGETGILDERTVSESINIALKDGVTVLPAPGARPWLDGPLRISGGNGWKLYGLNVRWTNADSSGHMVKLDGGSGEFAYAELAHAACYTLLRPGQTFHNSRIHHVWVHDNPGVSSHDGNQDHGLYCSGELPDAMLVIDHLLVEGMPRGRNIKVGGPSGGGGDIGGITIGKSTLRLGHGPSNAQVSNGATGILFRDLVLIDSGASTSLTEGSGAGPGSTYAGCWSDKKTGPNTANLRDLGGNTVKATSLLDYAANGAAGKGHLAP